MPEKKIAIIFMRSGEPIIEKSILGFLIRYYKSNIWCPCPSLRYLIALALCFLGNRFSVLKALFKNGCCKDIHSFNEEFSKKVELELNKDNKAEYKVFQAFQYGVPSPKTVVKSIKKYNPDHMVLIPSVPQFSSIYNYKLLKNINKFLPKHKKSYICSYPEHEKLITCLSDVALSEYTRMSPDVKNDVMVVFGISGDRCRKHDPFLYQSKKTAAALAQRMGLSDEGEYRLALFNTEKTMEDVVPLKKVLDDDGHGKRVLIIPVNDFFYSLEHEEIKMRLKLDSRYSDNVVVLPSLKGNALYIQLLIDLGLEYSEKEGLFTVFPFDKSECACKHEKCCQNIPNLLKGVDVGGQCPACKILKKIGI